MITINLHIKAFKKMENDIPAGTAYSFCNNRHMSG
jgi:hypothetical protein